MKTRDTSKATRQSVLTSMVLTSGVLTSMVLTSSVKNPICLSGLDWDVTIWDAHMQIGCEFHSHVEWAGFDSERIAKMDSYALTFWQTHNDVLLQLCKMHGAKK